VSYFKSVVRSTPEKINFSDGKWDVSKIIRDSGFSWREWVSNRKVLIEKDDIRAARLAYFIHIRRYRNDGCPPIYKDET
jgi:hypothetical protein